MLYFQGTRDDDVSSQDERLEEAIMSKLEQEEKEEDEREEVHRQIEEDERNKVGWSRQCQCGDVHSVSV